MTGGSGYIGSHVAKMLQEQGYTPIVFDLQVQNRLWANLGWEAITGDINDRCSLESVFEKYKIDAVIHLAAITTIERSLCDPFPYYDTNICGTAKLLEVCKSFKVNNIVFSSSSSVYGYSNSLPRTEYDRKEPNTAYGASKLAMEYLFRDIGKAYNINYVGLRYFNAAGASPDGRIGEYRDVITHLIPSLQAVVEGKRDKFIIRGANYDTPDGTAIRDFTHVWDIADAHIKALDYLNDGGSSDIFNIGGNNYKSILEMFVEFQLQANIAITVSIGDTRPGDIAVNYTDNSKAKIILNWEPKLSDKETIIRDALQWYASETYKAI